MKIKMEVVMDKLTPEKRSDIMRQVKGKNTLPEMIVRRLIHRLGYRFRLHRKDLPGTPDIVFPSRKKIILVHGCFWHGHQRCAKGQLPKSNIRFWRDKIESNRKRDVKIRRNLRGLGWKTLVVWQCSIKNEFRLKDKIVSFLQS